MIEGIRGMGEVMGVFIAAGLLALSNWWIAGLTFALAYLAGFALTVGPLVQEGVPLSTALRDALLARHASDDGRLAPSTTRTRCIEPSSQSGIRPSPAIRAPST